MLLYLISSVVWNNHIQYNSNPSPVILLNYTSYFLSHAVLCNTRRDPLKNGPIISKNNKPKEKCSSDCRLVHLRAGTCHYRKKKKNLWSTRSHSTVSMWCSQTDVMKEHRCLPQSQQRIVAWMATLNSPSSCNYPSFIGTAWSVRHSFSWERREVGKVVGASEMIHRCLRLHACLRVTNQRYH